MLSAFHELQGPLQIFGSWDSVPHTGNFKILYMGEAILLETVLVGGQSLSTIHVPAASDQDEAAAGLGDIEERPLCFIIRRPDLVAPGRNGHVEIDAADRNGAGEDVRKPHPQHAGDAGPARET